MNNINAAKWIVTCVTVVFLVIVGSIWYLASLDTKQSGVALGLIIAMLIFSFASAGIAMDPFPTNRGVKFII